MRRKGGVWRSILQLKFLPQYIRWGVISYSEVSLDYLVKCVFASCLHCNVTVSPFPYSLLWQWVSKSRPHSRWGGIKLHLLEWRVSVGIIWNSSVKKVGLPPLLVHAVIYWYPCRLRCVCAVGYNPQLHCSFCWSNCFSFGPPELFQVGCNYFFDMPTNFWILSSLWYLEAPLVFLAMFSHDTLFTDGKLRIYFYMRLVRDKNVVSYFYYI